MHEKDAPLSLALAAALPSCEQKGDGNQSESKAAKIKRDAARELKTAADLKERFKESADKPDASQADAADYAHSLVVLDEAMKKAKEAGVENPDEIVHQAWEDAFARWQKRHAERLKIDQDLQAERQKREEEARQLAEYKRKTLDVLSRLVSVTRNISAAQYVAASRVNSDVRLASITCQTKEEFREVISKAERQLVAAGVFPKDAPTLSSDPTLPAGVLRASREESEPLMIDDQ